MKQTLYALLVATLLLMPGKSRGGDIEMPISLVAVNQGFSAYQAITFQNKIWVRGSDLRTSIDGRNWDVALSASRTNGIMIVFNNKLWLLGNSMARYTQDGSLWTNLAYASTTPSSFDGAVVMNNKIWVVTSTDVWNSSDAQHWTRVTDRLPWNSTYQGYGLVAYNNKLWVVGGEQDNVLLTDAIWSSPDGVNWTKLVSEGFGSVECQTLVVYRGLIWAIGGINDKSTRTETDTIIYTSDGITWEFPSLKGTFEPASNVLATVLGDDLYLICPGDKSVYATIDNHHDAAMVSPSKLSVERRSDPQLTLTVKNTGSSAWSGDQGYVLQLLNEVSPPPFDNAYSLWTATSTIALPSGKTVAPGQSYTFPLPLTTDWLYGPHTLTFQMYSPDVFAFGPKMTLELDPIPAPLYTWDSIIPQWPAGMHGGTCGAVFNGRLWIGDSCSSDGVHWTQMVKDDANSPWHGGIVGYKMVVYKEKLWLLGGVTKVDSVDVPCSKVWSSSDGSHWQSVSDAPWKGDIHRPLSAFVCRGKLWVGWGGSAPDIALWNTEDGKNWTHVNSTDFYDLYDNSNMLSYGDRIYWVAAVDTYANEGDYYDMSISASGDGLDWSDLDTLPRLLHEPMTVAWHDHLWILGGIGADGLMLNDCYMLTPGNYLQLAEPLPVQVSQPAMALVFQDQIWVIMYDAIYRLTPRTSNLDASTPYLNFGIRDILASGYTSPKTVTLTNPGEAPVAFKSATLLGGGAGCYRLNASDLSPLPAHGSRVFSVSFKPAVLGVTTASLHISTVGPYDPALDVALTGTGTALGRDGVKTGILQYLLGRATNPAGLDLDGNGRVTVADLLQEQTTAVPVGSPASGAVWKMGNSQAITWSAATLGAATAKINLKLYRNHALCQTIADGIGNGGKYTWTVPFGLIPASDYTVGVVRAADGKLAGESPTFFTVAPAAATITVQAPVGGERWFYGEPKEIRWSAPAGMSSVRLSVYKAGQWVLTIDDTVNDGSYTWYVSSDLAPGSDYQIMVADPVNRNVRAASAATFSIVNPY